MGKQIICDVCKEREANRSFKVKLSKKLAYKKVYGGGITYDPWWKRYHKIDICQECAEKLLGVKK